MHERESRWYRGNALDLYSGGARFESRLGHRLHQLRFQRFSSVPPGKLRGSISFRSRPLPNWFFRGCVQSHQTYSGIVPQFDHDRLHPDPFKFINHQSSYNSMFYSVRYRRARKVNHKRKTIRDISIFFSNGSTALSWALASYFSF
jgi:hypothetical protein